MKNDRNIVFVFDGTRPSAFTNLSVHPRFKLALRLGVEPLGLARQVMLVGPTAHLRLGRAVHQKEENGDQRGKNVGNWSHQKQKFMKQN